MLIGQTYGNKIVSMRHVRIFGKVEEVLVRAKLYLGFSFVISIKDARNDD